MSEITKLYKNAGVRYLMYVVDTFPPVEYPQIDFNEKKQLELIILLANREIRISPTYISSGYYLNNLNKIKSSRNISTFENSLAQHINAIWQDLTEEEKQQVKGILEWTI